VSKPEEGNPFRSRPVVVALIVVALVVLAAVGVGVASILGGSPSVVPTAAASPDAPQPAEGDRSVCGLPGFEDVSSLTEVPDVKWELVGTVAAPTDPQGAGPGRVDADGFRSCFAHTAEGALFATINYPALSSDGRNGTRIFDVYEPGVGRDAAIAAYSADPSARSNDRIQAAGYRINAYSSKEAIVDVAWSVTSKGGLVSFPMVLHWVAGDWKLVLNDDGSFPFSSAALSNLGGYTPWSGV
jgi:hypothetical protein